MKKDRSIMKDQNRCARALWAGLLGAIVCAGSVRSQEEGDFLFQANVMIPMRDGVRLAANLFLPEQDGPFPTILIRTPYGKFGRDFRDGIRYSSRGYALLIQDCRGRGDSEGVWDPFRYDREDGFDTQEWIGRQPWSNGRIGTAGGSYVGWTQWASAPRSSRFLTTMVPVVPFSNAYDLAYPGGAYQLALVMSWGALVGGIQVAPDQLGRALRFLPLQDWDDQFEKEVFYLADWVAHPTYDEYWRVRSIDGAYDEITVPILNIGGWYDIFSDVTLEMIAQVRKESQSRPIRRNQFAVIGPWGHGVSLRKVGDVDFGPASEVDLGELQFQWFEYWLKDRETGVEEWPAYSLFIMGENRWRSEHEWPLKRTEFTPFYLTSSESANGLAGDGRLVRGLPSSAGEDEYVYDPENPVPTSGGNNLIGAPIGPFDQTAVERRDDVLVYSSPPLAEAIEVTGPVVVILYAASTATDTDFTAKLVDVHPDGKAFNLCDGIVRARYHRSRRHAELIEPGVAYRYEIDLWVTSNVFKAGHRIRVEISSSNFPRFDRNPNTGGPFGAETELRKATQRIFHGPHHSSHILLPVIPSHAEAWQTPGIGSLRLLNADPEVLSTSRLQRNVDRSN